MKERGLLRDNAPIWLAVPAAFAVYPLLSFYQHNIDQVRLGELAPALAVSLAAAVVLTGAGLLAFRRTEAAALGASALLAAFFSYGALYEVATERLPKISGNLLGLALTTNRVLTGVMLLALVALLGTLALRRFPLRDGVRLAGVLGVTLLLSSSVMTAMALVSVGRARPIDGGTAAETTATPQPVSTETGKASVQPDIYFIVLDRYMGTEALRDVSGYDNTPFTDALEREGFFVAEDSYSNYAITYLSLGATLNMRFLDDLTDLPQFTERDPALKIDRRPFYELIGDNEVGRFLKGQGYSYVHMTSGWSATDSSVVADRVIDTREDSEFANVLLQTTWARTIAGKRETGDKRERIERTFEMLDGVRDAAKPVFTFAHVMVPHPPYVFTANGGEPAWDADRLKKDKAYELEAYLEQLKYTNKLVLAQVSKLTEERGRPVIVVIQGDHGGNYRQPGATGEQLHRTKHSILNAVYYSGGAPETLYDSVSPVNTFRILLDSRFGTKMGLLPDRSRYSFTETWPYWPTDVTEEIRATRKP